MGENDNDNKDEKVLEADKGAENLDNKSKNGAGDEDKGDHSSDDNKDGKGDDKSKKSDNDAGDGIKKDDEDKSEKPAPKTDEEPTTRKRNIDFINERHNRKAEKDANKDKNNIEDDEDADIDDEDVEIIDKRVKKIIAPFISKVQADEDKQEIDAFVSANPDFKPYVEKVAKYAQHPSRSNMPIKAIFYEVAGDDLLKIGATRSKKADEEADKSKGGGGDGGESSVIEKPTWDMTLEEFAEKQQQVRSKPRD